MLLDSALHVVTVVVDRAAVLSHIVAIYQYNLRLCTLLQRAKITCNDTEIENVFISNLNLCLASIVFKQIQTMSTEDTLCF